MKKFFYSSKTKKKVNDFLSSLNFRSRKNNTDAGLKSMIVNTMKTWIITTRNKNMHKKKSKASNSLINKQKMNKSNVIRVSEIR